MPDINDPRLLSPQCDLTPVKKLHENEWFSVYDRGSYFTTEYNNLQVMILPTVQKQSVVMIRAIRPVIADCPLELPSGGVDENETPIKGAQRELKEETGICIEEINRFKALNPISNMPNRNPRLLHVYQVDISETEFLNRDKPDHEISKVELFQLKEIKELIISGNIYISTPLAVVARYLLSIDD